MSGGGRWSPSERVFGVKILFLCGALFYVPPLCAETPARASAARPGVTGDVRRHERFGSKFVDARNVDVWLPPGYEQKRSRRYPVVYMHDGQMLFDATKTWNRLEWGVDETMTRLVGEGRIREAIVVGVWNTPKRFYEYMPRKAVAGAVVRMGVEGIPDVRADQIVSDDYLKFLANELKPFVDATYRTLPGRENTFVMGSSMGGLISAYAVSEYPNVFGGAGCISTHWPAGDGAVIDYLSQHLPDPRTHKFYFDYGTETLDAGYEPYQRKMDAVMRRAGYREGRNWLTRKFAGAEHSERAWAARVDVPLRFFLRK